MTCNSFKWHWHFIVPEEYQGAGLMTTLRLDLSFIPNSTVLGGYDFVGLGQFCHWTNSGQFVDSVGARGRDRAERTKIVD